MVNWRLFSKLLFISGLFFSCNEPVKEELSEANSSAVGSESGQIQNMAKLCDPELYELDCIKNDKTAVSDELLNVFGEIRDKTVDAMGEDVTDARQDEYGDKMKKEIVKQFPIIDGHPKENLLRGLMKKLLQIRKNPSDIQYNIYVVRSEQVNAFTLGGEIFVTNRLLAESESIDELSCIIGHEIGHNELGHIADRIKEQEIAQGIFGEEAGAMVANVAGFITMGFNQINEAESDIYGIDLAISSGYDPCRGIDFWNRVRRNEGPQNDLDNMMRSHPYSDRRIKCYKDHLSKHHQRNCDRR